MYVCERQKEVADAELARERLEARERAQIRRLERREKALDVAEDDRVERRPRHGRVTSRMHVVLAPLVDDAQWLTGGDGAEDPARHVGGTS